jgi:hypothetical protein
MMARKEVPPPQEQQLGCLAIAGGVLLGSPCFSAFLMRAIAVNLDLSNSSPKS